MKLKQLGPKAFEVKAVDPRGRIWHGVFADQDRAVRWGVARAAGLPYHPIPKAGEV